MNDKRKRLRAKPPQEVYSGRLVQAYVSPPEYADLYERAADAGHSLQDEIRHRLFSNITVVEVAEPLLCQERIEGMFKVHEGCDDGFLAPVPIPIRANATVLICNIPLDMTASEAEKIRRVVEAMKPTPPDR